MGRENYINESTLDCAFGRGNTFLRRFMNFLKYLLDPTECAGRIDTSSSGNKGGNTTQQNATIRNDETVFRRLLTFPEHGV
jgi:hypothetical protein